MTKAKIVLLTVSGVGFTPMTRVVLGSVDLPVPAFVDARTLRAQAPPLPQTFLPLCRPLNGRGGSILQK